jgi:hypothetical protein
MAGRGSGACDVESSLLLPPPPRVTSIVLGLEDYAVNDVEVKGDLTLQVCTVMRNSCDNIV